MANSSRLTRRAAIKSGLAIAAFPLTTVLPQKAAAQERKVTKVLDFATAADVAKAEQEGEFLFYSHDSEPGIASILEAFNKDFPKIKGKYVRAQNGTLVQSHDRRAVGRPLSPPTSSSSRNPRPPSTSKSAAVTPAMSRRSPSSTPPSI